MRGKWRSRRGAAVLTVAVLFALVGSAAAQMTAPNSSGSASGVTLTSRGAISGVVRDPDTLAPLADICASAYQPGGFPFGPGDCTDANGSYRINNVPPGSYVVVFRDETFDRVLQWYSGAPNEAGAQLVTVTAGVTTSGIDANLSKAGRITGVVTDALTGQPVENVCARALQTQVPNGCTDDSGVYAIKGLAAGTYTVEFDDDLVDYPLGYTTTSRQVTVAAGATTAAIDVALSAPGGRLTGTVTDATSGQPLADAWVDASVVGTGAYGGQGRTRADGTYTIVGLAPNTYYARAFSGEHHDLLYGQNIVVSEATTTPGINFALARRGWIEGTMTAAADGSPVPGCAVARATGSIVPYFGCTTTSSYRIVAPGPGTYTVEFVPSFPSDYAPEYYNGEPGANQADVVTVVDGQTTSGIDATLEIGGRIGGTVTDAATGEPIEGICAMTRGEHAKVTDRQEGCTDENGAFVAKGLPADTYRVEFRSDGYVTQWWENAAPGAATPIALALGQTVNGIDAALVESNPVTTTSSTTVTTLPQPLTLQILDMAVQELDKGTSKVQVTVALSAPTSAKVKVKYRTLDDEATAPGDYKPKTGSLTLGGTKTETTIELTVKKGETLAQIKVPVKGDTVAEFDEQFIVTVAEVPAGVIGFGQATGTIHDDD